jgi:sulfide dehydrogenase cytochrome subunit
MINVPLSHVRAVLTRHGARTLLAAWVACASTAAWAQGQAPQKGSLQVSLWAASCMACHGAEGLAEGTGLSLSGRPADQLLSHLLDFKYGRRQATVMHQHARGYKDEELRLIAEYFANLKR